MLNFYLIVIFITDWFIMENPEILNVIYEKYNKL